MSRISHKRIKKITITWGFTFIIILLNYKFFNLIGLPGTYGARTNVILPSIVAIIFTICLFITRRLRGFRFQGPLLLFYCFLIIEIIYSVIIYPAESPIEIIKAFSTYLVLLSYFVFSSYSKTRYKAFLRLIIISSTIIMALFIFQALLYNLTGIKLLKIYQFSYGDIKIAYRNQSVRLIAPDLVELSTILSIGLLFENNKKTTKEKITYIINIIICIIYEFYATHTRSTLIIIFSSIFVCIFLTTRKNKITRLFLAVIGIIIMILVYDEVQNTIHGIIGSIESRSDYSLFHRVDAYKFYYNSFLQKPFLGLGLLPDNTSNYYSILHGWRNFTISDVGIVGVIARFGPLGLIAYVYLIVNTCKGMKRVRNKSCLLSVLVFIVLSMINLSLFDSERLISLSVVLVVIEYESMGLHNTKY